MPPKKREATPQATTSKESTPLAKRRREAPNDAELDNTTAPSTTSSFQHYKTDDALKLEEADCATVITDSKQLFSLDVLPKTVIAIECGASLSTQYQVPLSLLCEQSQMQSEIFWQAEDLHKCYATLKALRKRARAVYPLLEIHDIKHKERSRADVVELIQACLNDFPIARCQATVCQILTEATDKIFKKNDLFIKPTSKKVDRLQFPKNDVQGRLQQLQDEAVYTVLERLRSYLDSLKCIEKHSALNSSVKAAAQRRVILQNENPTIVEVLIGWLYKKGLSFTNIGHLYSIYALADKLGITRLAAKCIELLSTSTSRVLCQAKSEGVTLRGLLLESARAEGQSQEPYVNDDPLSSFCVVGEVFRVTLRAQNPPAVLQNLVADAIAESEDDELFDQLLPIMNLDMRGKIAMAMMRTAKAKASAKANWRGSQPYIYHGASRSLSIESEVSHDKDHNVKLNRGSANSCRVESGT